MVAATIEVAGVWGQREIAARKEGRKDVKRQRTRKVKGQSEEKHGRASEASWLVARGVQRARAVLPPCRGSTLPGLSTSRRRQCWIPTRARGGPDIAILRVGMGP